MHDITQNLEKIGISIDSILLPKENVDMTRWAVIACDQYTSEPEYWAEVNRFVSSEPSTLRLIYPEVYLDKDTNEDKLKRIESIHATMNSYLQKELFNPVAGPILIERTSNDGKIRIGVMVALDLDMYQFEAGSQSLIRATEGTIVDRLPPRVRIRENASLELPHIMVLIDDPDFSVIEPMYEHLMSNPTLSNKDKIYHFELMQNSGFLRGWNILSEKQLGAFAAALTKLADQDDFRSRYQLDSDSDVLLYAVGDGNHSLATAKMCWENIKKTSSKKELINHPAKYALVELVNIHNKGLLFEPIHRVLFHVSTEDWKRYFIDWHKNKLINVHIEPYTSLEDALYAQKKQTTAHDQKVILVSENGYDMLVWDNPIHELAVGSLQSFLDEYIAVKSETKIDYLHGNETTIRLGSKKENLGFLLPDIQKESFFPTVIKNGSLPRKTFSMGEAHEKRFYVECRKIKR